VAVRILGRVAHAEVEREAGEEDTFEAALLEVATEPRGRHTVVLVEGGVRIDRRVKALAQDELGMRHVESRMEGGAGRVLDAVVRPQYLRPVRHLHGLEGPASGMGGGEGQMPRL